MWFVDLNPLSTFLKSAGGSLPPRTDCTWPASSQCTGLASLRAGQVRFLSRAPPRRGEGGAALGLLWPGSCLPSPREAPHSPSCFLDLLLRDPGYSHSKLSFPRVLTITHFTPNTPLLRSYRQVFFSMNLNQCDRKRRHNLSGKTKQSKNKMRPADEGAGCSLPSCCWLYGGTAGETVRLATGSQWNLVRALQLLLVRGSWVDL